MDEVIASLSLLIWTGPLRSKERCTHKSDRSSRRTGHPHTAEFIRWEILSIMSRLSGSWWACLHWRTNWIEQSVRLSQLSSKGITTISHLLTRYRQLAMDISVQEIRLYATMLEYILAPIPSSSSIRFSPWGRYAWNYSQHTLPNLILVSSFSRRWNTCSATLCTMTI